VRRPTGAGRVRVVVVGYGMAGSRLVAEVHARDPDIDVTVVGAEPTRRTTASCCRTCWLARPPRSRCVSRVGRTEGNPQARLTVTGIDRAGGWSPRAPANDCRTTGWFSPRAPRPYSRHQGSGVRRRQPADRVASFRTLDDCRRILGLATERRVRSYSAAGCSARRPPEGSPRAGWPSRCSIRSGTLWNASSTAVLARCSPTPSPGLACGLNSMPRPRPWNPQWMVSRWCLRTGADLRGPACGRVRCAGRHQSRRDAGLEVDRGIVVNDRMRTNDPNIFAIGDCAQHAGTVAGLVGPAWEHARVVADVMTGCRPLSRYIPAPRSRG
jgi:assimilatory nitrate reductase electron transfer subunit